MKIYAVRHGQTDWNNRGRIQGAGNDLPLNDEGRRQARVAAERLKGFGVSLIVSSPMRRAMETAAIIADGLGLDSKDIIQGAGLFERNFGDYEGELINAVDIVALRRWTDDAPTPNGETMRELARRVFAFLDGELARLRGMGLADGRVVFVVHGHVLRVMYWYFNGLPQGGTETDFETENCGVYEFDA